MKRISLRSPLRFRHRGMVFNYAPRRVYEVEDDVARHPFIRSFLLYCEDVKPIVEVKPEPEEVKAEVEEKPKREPKAKKSESKSKSTSKKSKK